MEQVGTSISEYYERLSSKTGTLLDQYKSLLKIVAQQNLSAQQDPDNSVVFTRDFSKEIFMFGEAASLLLGENSNYGKALKEGTELAGKSADIIMKDVPGLTQLTERNIRLTSQLTELMKQEIACGDNDLCVSQVRAKMVPVQAELDEVDYEICLLSKSELDINYTAVYKLYKKVTDDFKEAAYDFYAFTNPVLGKIYAPSLNELLNIYRELVLLTHTQNIAGLGMELPGIAEEYNRLVCVEPLPPGGTSNIKDPEIPKKEKEPCPFGEKGISANVVIFSFELGCDHVKLSGGEGLLWSINRDFNKHETTFWGGIGVKGEYGRGNLSAEASVGVGMTVGQGDVLKNVEFTSSVKAGLGGLVEGEVNARWAIEGGPSIETGGGFITPDFPVIGEN